MKLSNSEILQNLPIHLSHLSESQRSDLVYLIESSKKLFSDVLMVVLLGEAEAE